MHRAGILILLGALSVLDPGAARAQEEALPPGESTLETARGLGMGSGARASARSSSALAYNAAGMPAAQLYHIESLVGYDAGTGAWSLGSAAVDSITNKLAAGLSIRGVLGGGDDAYNGFDARLGIAIPLAESISVGLGGRFLKLRIDQQDDMMMVDNQNVRHFTLDASIRVHPVEALSLVALGYNLIDTGSSLAPMLVGGGAGLTFGGLTIAGEGLVDLTTFDHASVIAGGGVEYLAAEIVPIRAGYRFDSGRDTHYVTGGIGYVDQHVGADVSVRQGVAGLKDTQLVLSFRYHVH